MVRKVLYGIVALGLATGAVLFGRSIIDNPTEIKMEEVRVHHYENGNVDSTCLYDPKGELIKYVIGEGHDLAVALTVNVKDEDGISTINAWWGNNTQALLAHGKERNLHLSYTQFSEAYLRNNPLRIQVTDDYFGFWGRFDTTKEYTLSQILEQAKPMETREPVNGMCQRLLTQ